MPTAPAKARPIIPWIGGKRRLVKHILPLIPSHQCYVEPFAGGAALFFLKPDKAKVEVLNDINGDLINLYRVVQHHLPDSTSKRWIPHTASAATKEAKSLASC